jgi:hypothetical protein
MTISLSLADILLGDQETAEQAVEAFGRTRSWREAIAIAVHWRVIPQLRSRLSQLNVSLADSDAGLLRQISAAAAAESALVCSAAVTAFKLLDGAGIRAAAFKGVATIVALGGEPAARMLSDADILIDPDDVPRALEVLSEAGFKPDVARDMAAWRKMLADRVYRIHDYLDVVNDAGARLDLHWNIRAASRDGLSVREILSRAVVKQKLSRGLVTVASAADAVILTSHHSVRDRLRPASVVKDLCDIEVMLSTMDDCREVAFRAREAGLVVAVLATVRILDRFRSSGLSESIAGESRASNREMEAAKDLAGLFELQLNGEPFSDTIMGMSGLSLPMLRRFASSRLRGLVDRKYRTDKFPGDGPPPARTSLSNMLSSMASLTPAKLRAYRSLATELRRYSD